MTRPQAWWFAHWRALGLLPKDSLKLPSPRSLFPGWLLPERLLPG